MREVACEGFGAALRFSPSGDPVTEPRGWNFEDLGQVPKGLSCGPFFSLTQLLASRA